MYVRIHVYVCRYEYICAPLATEQLNRFYSHWVLKIYSLVDSLLILTFQLQKQGPPDGAPNTELLFFGKRL